MDLSRSSPHCHHLQVIGESDLLWLNPIHAVVHHCDRAQEATHCGQCLTDQPPIVLLVAEADHSGNQAGMGQIRDGSQQY